MLTSVIVEAALHAVVLLVLVFVPALSFLALFRLIDYVADDELVARVENGEFQSGSPPKRERAVGADRSRTVGADQSGSMRTDQSRAVGQSNTDGTRCRKCGVANWDSATYCRNCLQPIA